MSAPPSQFYTYDAAYSHELAQHHLTLADQPDSGCSGWVYHKFVGCLESLPIIGIIIALCEVFFANCCCPAEVDDTPPKSNPHPLRQFLPKELAKLVGEYNSGEIMRFDEICEMEQLGVDEITFSDSQVACTLLPILSGHDHHIKYANLTIEQDELETLADIYQDLKNLPQIKIIFKGELVYAEAFPILNGATFDTRLSSGELRQDFAKYSQYKIRHLDFQITSSMPLLEEEVAYLSKAQTLKLHLVKFEEGEAELIPYFPNLNALVVFGSNSIKLPQNFPQLFNSSLRILIFNSGIENIDDVLLVIANRCPNLQKLSLGKANTMTDQGLRNLAELSIQALLIQGGKFSANGFCTYFQNNPSGLIEWSPEFFHDKSEILQLLNKLRPQLRANGLYARISNSGYGIQICPILPQTQPAPSQSS